MSTTNLFVELIVIGVSAFAWLIYFVLAIFDIRFETLSSTLSIPVLVIMLPLIYVLGILTDRIADSIFDKLWGNRIREKWFTSREKYYQMRGNIFSNEERMSDMLEYGRSRLRICRGWAFNSIVLALVVCIFSLNQNANIDWGNSVLLFLIISPLIIAITCWFAWKSLLESEYRKIKNQSNTLQS